MPGNDELWLPAQILSFQMTAILWEVPLDYPLKQALDGCFRDLVTTNGWGFSMEVQDRKDFEQHGPFAVANLAEPDALHRGDFMSAANWAWQKAKSFFGGDSSNGASKTESELPTVTFLKTQRDKAARDSQIENTAHQLASFIKGADKTLDIAIYSFNIKDKKAQKEIIDALNDRADKGVTVRLAFYENDKKKGAREHAMAGPTDNEDEGTKEFLAKLDPRIDHHIAFAAVTLPSNLDSKISTEGIAGGGHLMHNKYIVRDAGTSNAAVWTGSTNFTDDAFGTQDNNIIQLKSRDAADVYETNFNELWNKGELNGTGKDGHKTVKVGDSTVTIAFSPGDGEFIASEIARTIASAQQSVHIASMDVSNNKIMRAIVKKIDDGKTVDGIYDQSQMNVVVKQWERNQATESLAMWDKIKDHLVAKQGRGIHEMMHNKVVQVDDRVVVTGSFNYTSNATKNAENILVIEDPHIAKQYGAYISDLVVTYGANNTSNLRPRK